MYSVLFGKLKKLKAIAPMPSQLDPICQGYPVQQKIACDRIKVEMDRIKENFKRNNIQEILFFGKLETCETWIREIEIQPVIAYSKEKFLIGTSESFAPNSPKLGLEFWDQQNLDQKIFYGQFLPKLVQAALNSKTNLDQLAD